MINLVYVALAGACVDRPSSEGEVEHAGGPEGSFKSENCSQHFPRELMARYCVGEQLVH